MTPLSPFPFRSTAALFTYDFTDWASFPGLEIEGDAVMVDAWGGTNSIEVGMQQLFYWGNDPEAEQDPFTRSTFVKFPITGLPPKRLVFLTVGMSWRLGVWDQEFVGMRVNGTAFAPGSGPSGTLVAPVVPMRGYGYTDASGALELKFVMEGFHPSFNENFSIDNLTITSPEAELADIFYDAGVGYVAGNPFSITRGGGQFDPQEVTEDYDFPGKRAPVQGCDEVVSARPIIRTRFMLTGEYQFQVYRPGGSWSDHASIENARTYTPAAMGAALANGVYIPDFVFVWPRQRGDYIAVHFPIALVKRYGLGSLDKDEGTIDVEVEARIPAGEPIDTVPYRIHTYAQGTEVVG